MLSATEFEPRVDTHKHGPRNQVLRVELNPDTPTNLAAVTKYSTTGRGGKRSAPFQKRQSALGLLATFRAALNSPTSPAVGMLRQGNLENYDGLTAVIRNSPHKPNKPRTALRWPARKRALCLGPKGLGARPEGACAIDAKTSTIGHRDKHHVATWLCRPHLFPSRHYRRTVGCGERPEGASGIHAEARRGPIPQQGESNH